MDEGPQASVVVAVNGDDRVMRLVASLQEQSIPVEIIVVENGSHQLENALSADVRYAHLTEANMAAARNCGLHMASTPFVLTTDADVVAAPDWAQAMLAQLKTGAYAAVGGRVEKLTPKTWVQKFAITVVDGQSTLNYLPASHLPYVAGANAGFMREELLMVGGFDERFLSGSDVDICYKLGLAGHRVGLQPNAVVFHEDRTSLRAHFSRFQRYAEYQVLLFAKYRGARRVVLNPYPWRRVAQSFRQLPSALVALIRSDVGPTSTVFLRLVEAAAIWSGSLVGSIRYRQWYF